MKTHFIRLVVVVAGVAIAGCASQTASRGMYGSMSCPCQNGTMMGGRNAEMGRGMGTMKMGTMQGDGMSPPTTAPSGRQ
jgi:hypothetical protein